jgi:hypothetical protein
LGYRRIDTAKFGDATAYGDSDVSWAFRLQVANLCFSFWKEVRMAGQFQSACQFHVDEFHL